MKEPNTIDIKFTKKPLPKSTNFSLNKPNLSLLKNPKHFNAYTKNSFGSIPSNIITLLFFDNTLNNNLGFNSKSLRFDPLNTEPLRSPTPKHHPSSPSLTANPKSSDISYRKSRADYMLNIDHLISPGPGYYHNYYNRDNSPLRSKLNFRYNSIFNTNENLPRNHICPNKINPQLGPGSYDCEQSYNSLSRSINPKVYISTVPRKEPFESGSCVKVGPGSYNIMKDNRRNCYSNMNRFAKDKGSKGIMKSQSELLQNIRNALLEDVNRSGSPGPGSYELRKENFLPERNCAKCRVVPVKRIRDFKEEIKEEQRKVFPKEKKNSVNNKKNHNVLNIKNQYEIKKGKNVASFDNSSKRDFSYIDPYKKHVPGPCYYEQDAYTLERKYEWAPQIRNPNLS